MFEIFRKLKFFLSFKQRIAFLFLIILMSSSALLEIVGIGSIPIFVSAVLDYELLNSYLIKLDIKSLNFIQDIEQKDLLKYLSFILLILFVFKNILLMLVHFFQSYFSYSVVTSNSSKIYKKYLFSDFSFHANRNSATLIKNIISEISISSSFISSLLYLFRELIIFSLICFLLLINSPASFIYLSILFVFFLVLFYLILKNSVTRSGKKFYKSRDNLVFIIHQSLGFIKEVILLNKRNIFYKIFKNNLHNAEFQNVFMSVINKVPRLIFEILAVLICLLIVNYFFLHSRDAMLPILTLYGISLIRLIPSYTQISQSIMNIKYYRTSFDVICNELQLVNTNLDIERNELKNDKLKYSNNKEIKISNIFFSYQENKEILKKINLNFVTGQAIGIVGSSGSGKTTLGDLLMGLYTPNVGSVTYDGYDISKYPSQWKKMVGYVPQEVFILDNDIKKNIAVEFDDENIDLEKLERAIKFSNCEEFISRLPEGINTQVGERGIKLSGGQRQRIGIARALYNEPDIILFDEATSSLDTKNEKEIVQSIVGLKKNKTLICISHKLSNLKNMDMIIVLKEGTIDKVGNSTEIIKYLDTIDKS
jgi:ATP-binding cassette, subfamily B, bacterial PglK